MTRDGRNGTADFSGQGAATHGGRGGEDAADAVDAEDAADAEVLEERKSIVGLMD